MCRPCTLWICFVSTIHIAEYPSKEIDKVFSEWVECVSLYQVEKVSRSSSWAYNKKTE